VMTRAEIIIPDGGEGTLCRCYTDHVMSDVDKEQAKLKNINVQTQWADGLEVERMQCTFESHHDKSLYNTTHCYSPIGECFHEDKWHISGNNLKYQDKLHSSADLCDWEIEERTYGCLTPNAGSTNAEYKASISYMMFCGSRQPPSQYGSEQRKWQNIEMHCCEGEMCNTNITMDNEVTNGEHCYVSPFKKFVYCSLASVIILLFVGVMIFAIKPRWIKSLCHVVVHKYETARLHPRGDGEANPLCPCKGYCHCHPESRESSSPRHSREDGTNGTGVAHQSNNTTITNLPSEPPSTEITDGMKDSERGPALLVVRTIARQITISERVGSGRYGEVYQGEWQGTIVAVKKFHAWDDKSWQREYEIYGSLTHQNILGFIAADNKDNGQWTELWLVTEYHKYGSIYDYLSHRTVTPLEAVKMISTTVNGLEYIHKEIIGTSGKHAIAHRDVKSKNILVKSNGECCIGDLGLATRADWTSNTEPASPTARLYEKGNLQVGTKRYMAPEVLNNSLDQTQFNNFKRADVYSMSLVMWEVLNRTQLTPEYQCPPYRLPYYEHYPNDPSLEQMHDIIVKFQQRPDAEFGEFIYQNDDLLRVKCLFEECWAHDAMARLPTLRLKKSMYEIYEKMQRDSDSDSASQ